MDHSRDFILDSKNSMIPLEKWQSTIDLLAEIYDVPAAYIVQRGPNGYQVTIGNSHDTNPYAGGVFIPEETNIFCKKVVGDRQELYVDDASVIPYWDSNPEVSEDGFRSYYGMPIHWPDGDSFGTICIMDYKKTDYDENAIRILEKFRDVIELDLIRIEQMEMKAKINAALNHDLRTPLNAIMGYADAIIQEVQGPIGNKKYAEFGENILRSANHLLHLVDDMFTLSQAQGYTLSLDEEEVYLCQMVKDVSVMVLPQMRAKNIHFEIPTISRTIFVRGDAVRLKQIVTNLLNNAMKFTHPGGEISIGLGIKEESIELIVSDTGIGLSQADIQRVLQPVATLQRTGTSGERGTGLGLTIVQGLTALHGGHLKIESEVNKGSKFIITLPLDRLIRKENA